MQRSVKSVDSGARGQQEEKKSRPRLMELKGSSMQGFPEELVRFLRGVAPSAVVYKQKKEIQRSVDSWENNIRPRLMELKGSSMQGFPKELARFLRAEAPLAVVYERTQSRS